VVRDEDNIHRVSIEPATEHDVAMPITASKSRRIESAVERDEPMPITLTRGTVSAASSAIVGQGEPQPETVGEQLGVLGWMTSGVGLGYGIGQSVAGPFPGGVAGAAIGGAAAVATIRWDWARERAFRFVSGERDKPGQG